jgi:Gpi18-like mannosyltransferase
MLNCSVLAENLFHIYHHLQGKKWDFSFTSIWNTVVWLMLMNFFVKIVNSTAQTYLKKQQESELAALTKKTDSDTQ